MSRFRRPDKASLRFQTHKPSLELLEDRTVPTFLPPVAYPNAASRLAVDCNNDGNIDLVGNGPSPTYAISVSLGNGNGSFQSAIVIPGSAGLVQTSGDFNGDGNVDVVTTVDNFEFYDLYIWFGQGDGTFQLGASYSSLEVGMNFIMTSGDLNQDGFDDLLGTSDGSAFSITGYHVMLSQGDGTFMFLPAVPDQPGGYFPHLADLNEDGHLDFIRDGSYWQGNGDGTFTFITDQMIGSTVADFNNDGHLDLATSNSNSVLVRLGLGNGSFGAWQSYPGPSPGIPVVGDVNGDGRLDLLAGSAIGLTVYLGNGNGSFAEATNLSLAVSEFTVAGNFNADAYVDLATTLNNYPMQVYLNDQDWNTFPQIMISDASVTEGNTGSLNATFTLTLSAAESVAVTVNYASSNGTATAGSDFSAVSGTVTFSPGQTSRTITVPILGDRLGEANETFTVNLSLAVNGVITDNQATGTIIDNEPHVTITDVSLAEGRRGKKTSFNFVVSLTRSYDQAVALSYRTVNGTATSASGDYDSNTGSVTFSAGQTQKTITVTVNGDNTVEAAETFFAELYNLGSNAWFDKYRGLGTILNDD